MAAELDHVPDADRFRFAAACLLAALGQRIASPPFIHSAARGVLISGAFMWAALNMRLAGRMSASDAPTVETLAHGTALLFVVGALATARFGYRATIVLASSLATLLAAATGVLKASDPPTPMSDLYLALIVENLTVLALAVTIANAARRLPNLRQRPD